MAFRRTTRRFTRRKRDLVWTTAIASGQVTDGSTTTLAVASSGEWEASALNFERATLLRVRGYVAFTQDVVAATVDTSSMWAFHVGPLTFSPGDFSPFVSSDYDATDVLWTYGVMSSRGSAGAARATTASTKEIDIKAKRRMKSSEQLLFSIGLATDPAGAPTIEYQLLVRCLFDRT